MQKSLDLKRRLSAIKSINQITQAMQVITVVRTKNVQNRLKQAKKFQREADTLLKTLGPCPPNAFPTPITQIIIIGSSQGFCGAFNDNLIAPLELAITTEEKQGCKVALFVIGKKIARYLKNTGRPFKPGEDALLEKPSFTLAQEFITPFRQRFSASDVSRVILIFNRYHSMLIQQPTVLTLLANKKNNSGHDDEKPFFLTEPSLELAKEKAFRFYVESSFYLYLLESISGELGSRLLTMKNATDNSNDLIKQLTIAAHKMRQAGITQELAEIMTTFEALKEEE